MPPKMVCSSRNRCTCVETIDDNTLRRLLKKFHLRRSASSLFVQRTGSTPHSSGFCLPCTWNFLNSLQQLVFQRAVGSRCQLNDTLTDACMEIRVRLPCLEIVSAVKKDRRKAALPVRQSRAGPELQGNGERERIRLEGGLRPGASGCLLLGVTGGIATGKSTVSGMLEELGAATIDFDVLARQVVEPGKPAHEQIVAFFGKQILQEDGTIDRKRLSNIVFQDAEKRKKLEGFTHPQIGLEFLDRVNEITAEDPNAIIQVAVPLLIEVNMQHLFHKILLVYAPRETQIQRLVLRDRISEQEAARILEAQLPIDEKVGFADFVINNEKGLEETRRQVEDLWKKLKRIQEERKVKKPSA